MEDKLSLKGSQQSQLTSSRSLKHTHVHPPEDLTAASVRPPGVTTIRLHKKVSMTKKASMALSAQGSKFSIAPRRSRFSMAPRHSTTSRGGRISSPPAQSSKVDELLDFESLVLEKSEQENGPPKEELADFKALTDYFMGFWKAPHAAAALTHLEKLEIKRTVRALQKRHGFWYPPPELAEALKKPLTTTTPNFPDTKDGRNLAFVLKVLGCSLHENKPYKQFQKAKTLRQKRNWLYKYQGPRYAQSPTYMEPVCQMRLKRLRQFFPDRFSEEDGFMYFNNKILTYDEKKNLFYIGRELGNE